MRARPRTTTSQMHITKLSGYVNCSKIFNLIRLSLSIDKRIDLIVTFSTLHFPLEWTFFFYIPSSYNQVFKMNFSSWNHKLPINDDHWSMMIFKAFKPSAVSICVESGFFFFLKQRTTKLLVQVILIRITFYTFHLNYLCCSSVSSHLLQLKKNVPNTSIVNP